jgi:hypothetical protein
MGGVGSGNWYRYDKKTTAGETHSGLSSIKRYARGWSLSSSTEGKDNRRVEVTKVVLLYRTDLPPSVITRPWHVRVNRSPKLPEEVQLLLIAEHHLDLTPFSVPTPMRVRLPILAPS